MVKLVCIVIAIIIVLCVNKYEETTKIRYAIASCVLSIPMFILILKEDLWL